MNYNLYIIVLFFVFGFSSTTKDIININLKAKFNNLTNKQWHYKWNENGTAHRIYGNKISRDVNVQNKKLLELDARAFIQENNFLFNIDDNEIEVWVNDTKGDIRYLIFNQLYNGIPVWNSRIDFRYRLNGDMVLVGNDTFSDIDLDMNNNYDMLDALNIAKNHVGYSEKKGDYVIEESEQYIWVDEKESSKYYLTWLVELYVHEINVHKHELPVHRWKVFVDSFTGKVVNKIDMVQTATVSGYVSGGVKNDPYGVEFNRPLEHVEVQISGVGSTYTDENGFYSIEIGNQNRTATVKLEGSYINTNNSSGSDASISRTVIPGTTEDFIFSNANSIPSERDTYFHANLIHDWQKSLDPSFSGADYEMPANVNINDNCNAFWDGNSINMYQAGGGCPATGEMADVVYHEYGHGLQQFIYAPYTSPFDSGMGEGCADYWAMTITNSPCLGQGFFGNGTCLRDGNNTRQYPANECDGGVHCLGELTMGSMWKTRENLIELLGYNDGVERADDLFYFAQTARPNNVPDFLVEILIADDNDGIVDNGTPYYVSICDAFEEHNIECPISGPLSELEYLPNDEIIFELPPDATESQDIVIVNVGQPGSLLNYSLGTSPFESPSGGPDNDGTFWADSNNEPSLSYDWIDISDVGTLYNFSNNDDAGNNIDIGFDFEFYNQNYSQCIISPNGWVGFGNDNNAWDNQEIPASSAPSPAIFGFWDDLNPVNDNCNDYCSGNVYYHSNNDRMVIWFNEVAHWWTNYENSFYDFQIVLHSNGEINFNYRSIVGSYSPTIGMQNSSGDSAFMLAFAADPTTDLFVQDNFTVSFKKGAEWLTISPNSGELNQGSSFSHYVEVNTNNLIAGDYLAYVNLQSNAQNEVILPVSLTVGEAGLLGDVNQDGTINVLDVVSAVNFVTGQVEPTSYEFWASDLNTDSLLNVLDIVQMVNLVIG